MIKNFNLISEVENFTKQLWKTEPMLYMASPYKVIMTFKGHELEYYFNNWSWDSYCEYFKIDTKIIFCIDSKNISDLSRSEIQELKLKALEAVKNL